MSARPDEPVFEPADDERVPWTAVVPALLCAVTALVSVVLLGLRVLSGLRSGDPVTFYAIPTVLFDGSAGFAIAAYLIFVLPWTVAMIAACRRLFFPHRNAHRSVAVLLLPALALDFVAYVAVVSAGDSISEAHLPFGLWFVIGLISLALLGTRRTRRFEAGSSGQATTGWYDVNSDDGT